MTEILATLREPSEGVNAKVIELTRFVGRRYDPDRMSAAEDGATPRKQEVTCPTCRQRAAWQHNPHRPFCSLTCRLIDLGVWLDDGYRIPEAKREGDVP